MTSENDKVLDHTRLQLSALFDGELAMDEARFLKRRLEHDGELAQCWSRWQLAGDVLRGQATAPAPAGFADRVSAAIAVGSVEPAAHNQHRRRFWVPGAALAASVAAMAMFMTRQAPEVAVPSAPRMEIASAAQLPAPEPLPRAPLAPPPGQPQAPDTAAQIAAAGIAVAEVPRRAAERRSRAQQQRAAVTRASRNETPQRIAASATPAAEVANPFAPADAAGVITTKPWPRALLPHGGGAFNVGYGNLQPAVASAHPFMPRAPLATTPVSPDSTSEDAD